MQLVRAHISCQIHCGDIHDTCCRTMLLCEFQVISCATTSVDDVQFMHDKKLSRSVPKQELKDRITPQVNFFQKLQKQELKQYRKGRKHNAKLCARTVRERVVAERILCEGGVSGRVVWGRRACARVVCERIFLSSEMQSKQPIRQQCSSELSNSPEKRFDPIRRGPLLFGKARCRSQWCHSSLQGKVQNICEPWTECLWRTLDGKFLRWWDADFF